MFSSFQIRHCDHALPSDDTIDEEYKRIQETLAMIKTEAFKNYDPAVKRHEYQQAVREMESYIKFEDNWGRRTRN